MSDQKPSEMDWEDVRVFLAVARAGSLSGAARVLGVNQATIARRLARLEGELGSLTEKRPNGYVLTPAGQAAIAEAEAMDQAAIALWRGADGGEAIAGQVRISTLPSFAVHRLAEPLARLAIEHPRLRIELLGDDRSVSVSRGDADIAVRFGKAPETGDMLVRKLGALQYNLYAERDYAATTAPQDWTFIGFSEDLDTIAPAVRLAELLEGRPVTLRFNELGAQREAAAVGGGVAFLPAYLAETESRLAIVAGGADVWQQPAWLLLRRDVDRIARLRLVADLVIDAFPR